MWCVASSRQAIDESTVMLVVGTVASASTVLMRQLGGYRAMMGNSTAIVHPSPSISGCYRFAFEVKYPLC